MRLNDIIASLIETGNHVPAPACSRTRRVLAAGYSAASLALPSVCSFIRATKSGFNSPMPSR
ncbi:MAG: hypothetical protein KAT39_05555, partial [Alphaproteobacteria bacterium]|nr:hypothetical protein [Alphaproteobacteria bacterium]